MSEYDALLREADAMVAADGEALSGRTVYDGMPESHPTMRLIRLRDNRAALAAALRASEARVERLDAERIAIQNEKRLLTCVFCGNAYPPGTPPSNHEALKAHVAVCLKHPAAEFRKRAEAAEKRERAYREALLDLGRDCCAEAECENPWTHKSLREYGYGHYRCPEHAPEAKGGE
jgi:uncharacterized protein (UPF0335 family)